MKAANLLLGAAALALAACGSNEPSPEATDPGTMGAMATDPAMDADPMAGASAEAAIPASAQGFVDAAAASDMFEVESSRLAAKMAKDAKLKQFAEMMVQDHTKSTSDLKAAAAKATPAVSVKPEMTAEQQADLKQLQDAGDNFDRAYAQKQVAAHEKALALLRSYSTDGDSEPLKQFAAKTATVVSGHLDQAKNLPQ